MTAGDPVCICDGSLEAKTLCLVNIHSSPTGVRHLKEDQCSFQLNDQNLPRVSICDITFDADAHSQVLQFSSKGIPSLAERVNHGRALVASGDYLRAGAQIGPDNGVFETSFENEQLIFPDAVQSVINGKDRETVEHIRVRNAMSTGRSTIYQQLESPHPPLYYYT